MHPWLWWGAKSNTCFTADKWDTADSADNLRFSHHPLLPFARDTEKNSAGSNSTRRLKLKPKPLDFPQGLLFNLLPPCLLCFAQEPCSAGSFEPEKKRALNLVIAWNQHVNLSRRSRQALRFKSGLVSSRRPRCHCPKVLPLDSGAA